MGTTDGSGTAIPAHPFATSEEFVSGATIRAKANKAPYWGSPNSLLRLEPTWGDVDILVRIMPRLGSNNSSQLIAAFSGCSASSKVIQTIRNASAHNNPETFADVQALRSAYITFPISHPIHALYWTDTSSGDFLAIAALEDLVNGGLTAIS
jgi:hypothetical protein